LRELFSNQIFNSSVNFNNIFIPRIPDSNLSKGIWLTQIEMSSNSFQNINKLPNDSFSDFQSIQFHNPAISEKKETDSIHQGNQFLTENSFETQLITSVKSKSKTNIQVSEIKNPSMQQMIVAVSNSNVEKPPADEQEKYIPFNLKVDDIVSYQKSVNISEMMKGKEVEDLLEIEWLSVKNVSSKKAGMVKISEGRIIKPLDWIFDSLTKEDKYDEIIELQSLSLQFQSLLYVEIARNLIPLKDNNPAPFTICKTEVSLKVDISASMTTLNHSKFIGA
jgi:hypothetical protein